MARGGAALYSGDDCDGNGVPGLYVGAVGTIGAGAKALAETGITYPNGPDYISDPAITTFEETITDLTDTTDPLVTWPLDPDWTECLAMRSMIENLRNNADFFCSGGACVLPAGTTADSITFIDDGGDSTDRFLLGPTDPDGMGVLVVTGRLRLHGKREWTGIIMAVGRGEIERYGSGNGDAIYCTNDITASNPVRPYNIVSFLQK